MARLTTKQRKALPKGKFALPGANGGAGAYPVEDKSHAGNAKARAAQQVKAGRLSKGQEAEIDAKANRVLRGKGK